MAAAAIPTVPTAPSIEAAVPQAMFRETFVGMANATSAETKIARDAHAATSKDYRRKLESMKRQAEEAQRARVKTRTKTEIQQRLDQAMKKPDGSGLVNTSNDTELADLHSRVPPLEHAIRDFIDPKVGLPDTDPRYQNIMQRVVNRLRARPDTQALFTEAQLYNGRRLPLELEAKLAKHVLNDPEFMTILRGNHDAAFGTEIKADPVGAKAKLDAESAKLTEITTRKGTVDGEFQQVTQELEEYKRNPDKSPFGSKAVKVDDAKQSLPQAQENTGKAQKRVKELEDDLDAILKKRRLSDNDSFSATLDKQIGEARKQLTDAEADVNRKLGEERKLQQTIKAEENLRSREKQLKTETSTLDRDQKTSQAEVDRLTAPLKSAESDYNVEQRKIMEQFDSVIEESVEDWANKRKVQTTEELLAYSDQLEEQHHQAGEEQLANDLDLLTGTIREKWTNPARIKVRRKGKFTFERDPSKRNYNKENINAAYEILMTRGDDGLVDHMFPGDLTDEQRKHIKPELVRMALRFRLGSGGEISDIDRSFISTSPWGKKMVEDALVNDPALARKLAAYVGTTEEDPDLARKAQRKIGVDPMMLMMLLAILGQTATAQEPPRQTS